jgi:hypothetical protein
MQKPKNQFRKTPVDMTNFEDLVNTVMGEVIQSLQKDLESGRLDLSKVQLEPEETLLSSDEEPVKRTSPDQSEQNL